MRSSRAALLALAGVVGCAASDPARDATREPAAPPPGMVPRFTEDGALLRPEGWEGWMLAGTSMGLSYDEPSNLPGRGEPPGSFLNVYMQPWAWERFEETGEFPEGTMFVLAGAEPVRKAEPALNGFYQGELSLLEVHVKREGLHESGWGFFGFGGGDAESAPLIPGEASCYSCHRDHTAFDNVFVQFYPPLRERLGLAETMPPSDPEVPTDDGAPRAPGGGR